MGVYDRDYYRGDDRRSTFGARSMVVNLILANVVCYVAQLMFAGDANGAGSVTDWMELHADYLSHPWRIWELVTYGFAHNPRDIQHILFNMVALWFFGRDVEGVYGPIEFLRIYLTLVVMSGLVWMLSEIALGHSQASAIGASGAVMGVMTISILHFPRRTLLFWGILPLPAWVLGTFYVLYDISGTLHPDNDHVAHVSHLAGAFFGFIYFRSGWNLGRLSPSLKLPLPWRTRLRVHNPDADSRDRDFPDSDRRDPAPADLNRQVDRILEKISRQGEASLTRQERRTLEEASRRAQRRREF